jgi:hypothetical protein
LGHQSFGLGDFETQNDITGHRHGHLQDVIDAKVAVADMNPVWTHVAHHLHSQRLFTSPVRAFSHGMDSTIIQVEASYEAHQRPMTGPMLVGRHPVMRGQFRRGRQLKRAAVKQTYATTMPQSHCT